MRRSSSLAGLLIKGVNLLYIKPIHRLIPQTTFTYLVCGVTNYFLLDTLLYFVIYNYVVAKNYIEMGAFVISPHIAAMIILFPITTFNGFWLNRNVAFKATERPAGKQLIIYLFTTLGAILISYGILKLLVEVCHLWATPAKLTTTAITTIYSYLAARFVTFKK